MGNKSYRGISKNQGNNKHNKKIRKMNHPVINEIYDLLSDGRSHVTFEDFEILFENKNSTKLY